MVRGMPGKNHDAILDLVRQHGTRTYAELAKDLRVSTVTVRRAVDKLDQDGRLIKLLRGARAADAAPLLLESAIQTRIHLRQREKAAIAAAALSRVAPGQTIFLDGSTTCLEFAQALAREQKGLTIVTPSALLSLYAGAGGAHTVVCLGGVYDPTSMCLTGPETEAAAERLYVDAMFVSTKGFLPAEGTFESSPLTYRIKQLVARRCRRVVLLVDHSKFGERALAKVLDIAAIHEIVTDDQAPAAALAALRRRGCTVTVAPPLWPTAGPKRRQSRSRPA